MTPRAPRRSERARPVTRWVLLATLLAGIMASLALHGLLGASTAGRRVGPPVLEEIGALGPVLEVGDGSVHSAPGRPDTVGIALVGSGSGDVRARAAAVLAQHRATATWFVSGRTLLDDPGAVAAARDRGVEVGVTGFSGSDLAALPAWRVRVELSSAQAVLAAREGITTPLLLLPSSATRAAIDHRAVATARSRPARGTPSWSAPSPRRPSEATSR